MACEAVEGSADRIRDVEMVSSGAFRGRGGEPAGVDSQGGEVEAEVTG